MSGAGPDGSDFGSQMVFGVAVLLIICNPHLAPIIVGATIMLFALATGASGGEGICFSAIGVVITLLIMAGC